VKSQKPNDIGVALNSIAKIWKRAFLPMLRYSQML